ncbi:MAG: DUF6434 domain-containing protein [Phycicoccus sp.]
MSPDDARPPLAPGLPAEELLRWYWLRSELVGLARALGVPASGSKAELTDRLHRVLGGAPPNDARPPRRAARAPLPEPLMEASVIPPGQRSTQQLRAWFTARLGPSFRFDGHLRGFLAGSDGSATLGDALAHWHATRALPRETPAEQFEYNRFTRQWWREHPGGDRAGLAAAWRAYRGTPTNERARV